MRWSKWNAKRLLAVELGYRLSRTVYTYSNLDQAMECSIGEKLGKVLDNREDQERSNYIIPSLRERPFESLYWDIIQRYRPNHTDRSKLESALQISYELRFAKNVDKELQMRAQNKSQEINFVREKILSEKPPKFLIPKWSDMESQLFL